MRTAWDWLFCVLFVLPATAPASDEAEPAYRTGPKWRFEHQNDVFFQSDDFFSNAISAQHHSNIAASWADIEMPEWLKFGHGLPGLGAANLHRRMSIAIEHVIQTPDDLKAKEPSASDAPYAAFLGLELAWTAFDDDRLRAYGVVAGVVGPLAGAEQIQRFFHTLTDDPDPQGWDRQLPNEAVVNFNGTFKKKFARVGRPEGLSADFAVGAGFGFGTAMTFAEASLEARWGRNLPRGFSFAPSPGGRGVSHDASLIAAAGEARSLHFSVTARTVAMPYTVFVDGSLWHDSPSVTRKKSVNELVFGIHMQRRRWGIHFSLLKASEVLGPDAASDRSPDFGAIAIEWLL